ncbi:MAG: acetoacetate--CoA ligase [Halioglobus sp.]
MELTTHLYDEPDLQFRPDEGAVDQSQLTDFMRYCEGKTGQKFTEYAAFERFSVEHFRQFWHLFVNWADIVCEGDRDPVCTEDACETAEFFPNLRLNFSEAVLGDDDSDDSPAITGCHQGGRQEHLTRSQLRDKVCQLAAYLEQAGVGSGDRVAVIARNNIEAIIAALATARIGAMFASCAPNMGAFAILSRFEPLEPVVLIGNVAPMPFDTGVPIADRFGEVAASLPSLRNIILLDEGPAPANSPASVIGLEDAMAIGSEGAATGWQRFPFNHPLFILFSSGTTGAPKCIVHGAGGTLIEHMKEHRLHCGFRPGDKLFYNTTCAWMMWNWQLTALASGTELVVYDGPLESAQTLWRIVEQQQVSVFGTSPPYLKLCESAGFSPRNKCDLAALRGILSTGSILYPGQYDWVNAQVKNVPLQSISGGTDIVGCFVLGNTNLPVYRGEAQCRSLALDVRSQSTPGDESNPVGELICANPFPSRPVEFYGDSAREKIHAAYFAQNPGVWTHGDLIEFTPSGGARMHGRSDGVLNINGIRIGPAEIYLILQDLQHIEEALVVEQADEREAGGSRMVLLVVLTPGCTLDQKLVKKIRTTILQRGSTVLLPGCIAAVSALPKTHSGKVSETAARDAVNGRVAQNREALQNADCLEEIANHGAVNVKPLEVVTSRRAFSSSPEDLTSALQGIFAKTVGLKSIDNRESIHDIGLDSLQLTSILVEIELYLGKKLPFNTLLAAQDINQLSTLIADGACSQSADKSSQASTISVDGLMPRIGPTIRPAELADVDGIVQLLDEGLGNERVTRDSWRDLFDYAWLEEKPGVGFVALDGKEIVGFIGVIYASRRLRGKPVITANLTSWYVRPQYRGLSVALMAAAVEREDITYISLTPGSVTAQVLTAMGFERVASSRILLPPLLHFGTLLRRAKNITFDHAEIDNILNDEHRQIFRDHLPYDCLHALIRDGEKYCYLVSKRRLRKGSLRRWLPIKRDLAYSELVFCSDWDMLWSGLEWIKLKIMWEQRTVGIAVESGHAPAQGIHGFRFKHDEFYKSRDLAWTDIDKLYSEVVLLPI